MEPSKCRLEACVREIDTWMFLNRLKLNKDKTELIVISSLHLDRPTLSHLHVCNLHVSELNLKYLSLPTRLFMVSLQPTLKIFSKTTIHHATLGLQRRIYSWSLCLTQIVTAVVLLLRRFFGTVFLSILGMLDLLKDGLKQLFLYELSRFMKWFWCFIIELATFNYF